MDTLLQVQEPDWIAHEAVQMSNDCQQITKTKLSEQVAEKIVEAIQTEASAVSAESLKSQG